MNIKPLMLALICATSPAIHAGSPIKWAKKNAVSLAVFGLAGVSAAIIYLSNQDENNESTITTPIHSTCEDQQLLAMARQEKIISTNVYKDKKGNTVFEFSKDVPVNTSYNSNVIPKKSCFKQAAKVETT